MILGLIEEGFKDYSYLLDWKKFMLAMRNDIRYRELLPRQLFKKKFKELKEKQSQTDQIGLFDEGNSRCAHDFESFHRASYEYAPGAITVEGRKILLEYLLYIQEKTGYTLIEEDEIQAILECWMDDGITVERTQIQPQPPDYDGPLVFRPDGKINTKETQTPYPMFKVTIEFKLEESELIAFLKERQIVTGKNLFYFPDYHEFEDPGIVYNKATFIVCQKDITTQSEANLYVYDWLGWGEVFPHDNRTTKMGANYLLLTAIRDALNSKMDKNKYSSVDMVENEKGQFELVF